MDLGFSCRCKGAEVITELRCLYKCPPVEYRREGISVGNSSERELHQLGSVPLLLVVYRNVFELVALGIGSARSNGPSFAIGRHDNCPGKSNLSVFLGG
jgi:hypothetical protein